MTKVNLRQLKSYDFYQMPDLPMHILRRAHEEEEHVELHSHNFLELVIVQEGRGYHTIDDITYPISAGNIFHINLEQTHKFINIEHLTILNVMYDYCLLENNKCDLHKLPNYEKLLNPLKGGEIKNCFIDEISLSKIVFIADELISELSNKKTGFKTGMLAGFLQILLIILRKSKFESGKFYNHTYQISKIIAYIEKYYIKEITLDKLAAISKMSVSTMRKRFAEATAFSPIGYLLRIRIEKAATLLVSTQMPITEIAFKTGFKDSSYFSYQFKKLTNTTPLQYRENRKNVFSANTDKQQNT